jgi:hypothetical protein
LIEEPKRLLLCSGPVVMEGFKTLDVNPDYKTHYCAYIPPLPRVVINVQWDEIYLIHGIEHFYYWEALELIRNIYDALAPGGFAVFEQPNLKVTAEIFLGLREPVTEDPKASGINAIYGDPVYGNPYMSHRWGWTPDALRQALVDVGFEPAKIKIGLGLSRSFSQERDFRIEATK